MSEPPPQLGYAPPPPLTQRRGFRLWLILLAVLIGLIAASWLVQQRGLPAYRQWQQRRAAMAAWERCNAFTAPPDEIVFSELPSTRRTSPKELLDLTTVPTIGWRGSDHADPLLFMHGRNSTPDPRWHPERQLVLVHVLSTRNVVDGNGAGTALWFFRVTEIVPTHTGNLGQRSYSVTLPVTLATNHRKGPLRFYAGQPDPADPARFTIAYEIEGQPGLIEGRIPANYEPQLRVLSGPATRPAR